MAKSWNRPCYLVIKYGQAKHGEWLNEKKIKLKTKHWFWHNSE